MKDKKVVFSGIQPSGNLTVGNYIGALRNWVAMQDQYDCVYCLVDLHAMTVTQEPKDLRKRCLDFLAQYLAAGIDPDKSRIFVQSHVSTHAELAWILGCFTYMGELNRMTQFKDKARKNRDNLNAGLYTYPVLMAADILLYGAHVVPVGDDQRQHVELTRDVAQRFNSRYGEVFVVPEHYIPPLGARIMSLQEPASKMSKSDENPRSYIALLDPPDVIRAKIRRAVTDSGVEITHSEDKPAIANLMAIYAAFTGDSFEEIEEQFSGKGYAEFKEALSQVVIEGLAPFQERYRRIRNDRSYLDSILKEGAEDALKRSRRMMEKIYRKVGFIPRPR